jgi:EAL domain-containing protein (putative c-di-GMP-specific phosphodiesterase class I)
MTTVARFLAFAFASADLLVELDASRRVVVALGAQGRSGGKGAEGLIGRHIAEIVAPQDRAAVAAFFAGIAPGERRGPLQIRYVKPDGSTLAAELFGFALPELAPNISCAVAFTQRAAVGAPANMATLTPEHFRDKVRDLVSLAASRGRDLSLALVEINGLVEARNTLPAEEVSALLEQVRMLIANHGADGAAADLSVERFALLQDDSHRPGALSEAMSQLLAGSGAGLSVNAQSVTLSGKRDPLHQFRAVRAALDLFLQAGLPNNEATLRRSFAAVLDETARSATRLGDILSERRFHLYFQPVVDLKSEAATHHEVLIRFDKDAPPTAMIKLAEDLAIIENLDAAVVEQAVRRLRAPGSAKLKLAVNVSGATLLKDAFLERLLTATNPDPRLRGRLQLEITETSALSDLDAAGRRIRALREAGFMTSIDDFGSGAANYDYIRALPVNAVKIDGRYVRGIDRDPRAQTIVKHLVQLCSELGLTTVAEMIEREEELTHIKGLGIDCGQGWLFGRAEPEPCAPQRLSAVRPAVRRVGEQETWG